MKNLLYFSSIFFTLLANKINSKRFGARLSHRLNRKFVRTDYSTQDSEETATAFTVSKSTHNSRTKLYFENPRIKIQENMARSIIKLLVFVALQPLSSYSWNTHTHTHTVSFTVSLVRLRLEAWLYNVWIHVIDCTRILTESWFHRVWHQFQKFFPILFTVCFLECSYNNFRIRDLVSYLQAWEKRAILF